MQRINIANATSKKVCFFFLFWRIHFKKHKRKCIRFCLFINESINVMNLQMTKLPHLKYKSLKCTY